MRAGRIIAVVVGAMLAVFGFGLLGGGGVLVGVHATARDDAGFFQTSSVRLDTSTAVLTTPVEIAGWAGHPLGTVRITAQSTSAPVFVGIAPAADVDRWLAGTTYDRLVEVGPGPAGPVTRTVRGSQPVTPPGAEPFWVASATGSGPQSLTWLSEAGDWAVVLMNADARPGVAADVSVGSDSGLLLPVGALMAAIGLLILGAGVAFMIVSLSGAPATTPAAGPPPVPGSYPVRLDAQLDPALSRWLWLLKWFLAIPHYVVLGLLWIAVVPLTLVAGLAILFTGRYPRSVFEFNVGVMRWTWRVSYYAFSALGTDRYPPFSLRPDPTFPADLSIDYPQRLSRGLVLVKWWLLAIPHYIVVAVFAGGWTLGVPALNDDWQVRVGSGLIGILALVAAVVLLIGGSYPTALFDVVMGMNRWCYRVLAYAALMRDEYPPFRFDPGGTDPGSVPVPPPPPPPQRPPAPELVGAGSGPAASAR